MKIAKVLSASVLAGAMMLTATGCAKVMEPEEQPKPKSSASSTPSPSSSTTSEPEATSSSSAQAAPSQENPEAENTETEDAEIEDAEIDDSYEGDNEFDYSTVIPEEEENFVPFEAVTNSEPATPDEVLADEQSPTGGISNLNDVADYTAAEVADTKQIQDRINEWYGYILNPANKETIIQAGKGFKAQEDGHLSEADTQVLLKRLPQGFKFYDTSSPENIENAYVQMATGAIFGGQQGTFTVRLVPSGVSFYSDQASIDLSQVKLYKDGILQEAPETGEFQMIKIDGQWFLVPVAQF